MSRIFTVLSFRKLSTPDKDLVLHSTKAAAGSRIIEVLE